MATNNNGGPLAPSWFIPLDSLPTRFHSLEQVKIWHIRRVILDSATLVEAAERLGITKKTLWEIRGKYGLEEVPGHVSG